MKKNINIFTLYTLHRLIDQKKTGAPNDLAQRLTMSRSTLYDLIASLRDEMHAPINYNKTITSYEYTYHPKFHLDCFNELSKPEEKDILNGAMILENQHFSSEEEDTDFEESDELEDIRINSDDDDWYKDSSTENQDNEATSNKLCYDEMDNSHGGQRNEAMKAFLNDTETFDFVFDTDINFNDLFCDWV